MRCFQIFRALVIGLGLFGAGCNTPPPGEHSSALEPEPAAGGGNCCYSGAVACAADGFELDYEALGCGGMTKPTAQRACARHCGEPCTDSGWQPSGLCP